MPPIESILVALTLVFFILRAIFRGLRWLVRAATAPRREQSAVPPQSFRNAALPPDNARVQVRPAPPVEAPVPRRAARAQQTPSEPEPPPATAPPADFVLQADKDQLLRALVWQEILAPPLSRRRGPDSRRTL